MSPLTDQLVKTMSAGVGVDHTLSRTCDTLGLDEMREQIIGQQSGDGDSRLCHNIPYGPRRYPPGRRIGGRFDSPGVFEDGVAKQPSEKKTE